MSSESQDGEYGPAPGELELIREFVNTVDLDHGTEELASPEALAAWLEAHGFPSPSPPTREDHERAIEFREQLRALLLANNGQPLDDGAVSGLDAAADRAGARLAIDRHGAITLRPVAGGVDGLVAGLLAIASRAQAEGTWGRLKACPDETCAWAFYDESRNSSRTWCSMGVCGNRAKTRRYRERRKAAQRRG